MKNSTNDEDIQCPECYMYGMSYGHINMMDVAFVGGTNSKMPKHSHLCENCGHEYRTSHDLMMNLRIRVIFHRYYYKFNTL